MHVLLIAAHGTASPIGSATTAEIVAAVAAARPDVDVRLCFLDVVEPSLRQALDGLGSREVVVVPLLLSAGYHVLTDIPAVVEGRPGVRVARHLGPDPLLADALADRLAEAGAGANSSTVLVSVGSSRPQARAEVDAMAALLAARQNRPVTVLTAAELERDALAALPAPVFVVGYLLAEGSFFESLRATTAGVAELTAPVGAHPSLVELVLARYDAALA